MHMCMHTNMYTWIMQCRKCALRRWTASDACVCMCMRACVRACVYTYM